MRSLRPAVALLVLVLVLGGSCGDGSGEDVGSSTPEPAATGHVGAERPDPAEARLATRVRRLVQAADEDVLDRIVRELASCDDSACALPVARRIGRVARSHLVRLDELAPQLEGSEAACLQRVSVDLREGLEAAAALEAAARRDDVQAFTAASRDAGEGITAAGVAQSLCR